MSTIRIEQVKSKNGCDKPQLATLQSLGLGRIGKIVEHEDVPQLRGMIRRVSHLVKVEEG
ncbi:MAG: 50S ribosomal protein L30 [Actinomycetes bacterium]